MIAARRGWDLTDRVVVITGGARGIGAALAARLVGAGAVPALLDLDGGAARATALQLGGGAVGLQCDVRDELAVDRAMEAVLERLGGIDVLVANAGVGPGTTTVHMGDRARQRAVLDVNLHGVWHTVWAGGPHVADRQGHVLLVSSIASFLPLPTWAAYAASKAGVEQLGRALRAELARDGASCGVAHLGLVETGLATSFLTDPVVHDAIDKLPGWVTSRMTADAAAEALLRGIRKRAPRIIAPARYVPVYALRGTLGPLLDGPMARSRTVRSIVDAARDRDRARTKNPQDAT